MSTDDLIFTVLGVVGLVVAVMWAIGEYRIKKENRRRDAEAKHNKDLRVEQAILRHKTRKGEIDLSEIGKTVLEAMPEDHDLDRKYRSIYNEYPARNLYVVPTEAPCQDYSSSSSSVGSQHSPSSASPSSKGCFGSGGSSFSDSGSSGGSSDSGSSGGSSE